MNYNFSIDFTSTIPYIASVLNDGYCVIICLNKSKFIMK